MSPAAFHTTDRRLQAEYGHGHLVRAIVVGVSNLAGHSTVHSTTIGLGFVKRRLDLSRCGSII